MLYKQKSTEKLSLELFENPTSEYRGAPFWAWNCALKKEELEWQLEVLKMMGFGGAHMHVRTGMSTPYLSDEYMELIRACVEKAKKEGMLAWLYDEDRWPSGAAGGLVTKEERFRARYLLFTPTPYGHTEEEASGDSASIQARDSASAKAGRAENGRLLACFDVELDSKGYLKGWEVIPKDTPARHEKWYAYLEINKETPWYNNQTYVNTLDKAAMDRFIEITYESYLRAIGEEFDKTVPAIFTDEPQFVHKSTLKFATDKSDVILPWTDDLPDTFAAAYAGEDILGSVPELVWERADGKASVLRYHYHDHVCERFAAAFTDNCGKWCSEHGLALTGHMMGEPTLRTQTSALGEAMRCYRSFELPGFDICCAWLEYTTAKQAQSAVHQYGREGLISELYSVTNWDFDFRGHKLHGDWQAALGATIRVPHLSWVSMEGEAKRDFPASINYQSPWWEKYSLVEDHFARVATAMTRGKALVKVGVIHPVESYWLHWGPAEQTALVRDKLDTNFQNLTKWLIFGGIDFDFISESLLPDLCSEGTYPLKVGEMAYDVILVPGCETLRSTTLERLEAFAAAGGKLIFAGDIPDLENALPSDRAKVLAGGNAQCISFSRGSILEVLESARLVEIRTEAGVLTENLLHQLRQDGENRWLFIAHGTEPYNKDISKCQDLRIKVQGQWDVQLYNTMNGQVEKIAHKINGDATEIYSRMYDYDSLLLYMTPGGMEEQENDANVKMIAEAQKTSHRVLFPSTVPYTLDEPNVMLLDQAEYALDEEDWVSCEGRLVREEILKIDDACRVCLGWPSRKASVAQPWAIAEEPITHAVRLRFRIQSEIEYTGAKLAVENAEKVKLKWNGQELTNAVNGWYVDKAIQTVSLPALLKGENILEITVPLGRRNGVEWCYLLGDFGVEVTGRNVRIVAARKELAFGDMVSQGLPFYGGNITYHIPVETKGGEITIRSSQYKGVLQTVQLDGGEEHPFMYPPYIANLGTAEGGKHTVDLKLYGHRRNGFGPVHLTDLKDYLIGPGAWRSEGENWCYEYMLCQVGVMTTPVITEER